MGGRASMIPPLKARDPAEAHRVSTQLELLFDLISVIAISAVTNGLHQAITNGHGVEALPAFLFMFTGIWWAWMNFTWFASAFDNDEPFYWLLVMVIMTGQLIFAGGARHIFATLDAGWGIVGWTIMRIGMAALWTRTAVNREFRTTSLRYAAGILLAQAGWIGFYFSARPGTALFYPLAVSCFLVEFAVPPFAESAGATPFHRHHIIERYGLLTIISLGEIMLAISSGFGTFFGGSFSASILVTTMSALLMLFAMFWIYFCEREHLPTREFGKAFIWGYGHIFIFGAIAVLGAGIGASVDLASSGSEVPQKGATPWLGLPLAIFLAALWIARDRHFQLGMRAPALPTMALAALAAVLLGAPVWMFAVISVGGMIWRVPFFGPKTDFCR
jgi:low temperature requirement protein LtrA